MVEAGLPWPLLVSLASPDGILHRKVSPVMVYRAAFSSERVGVGIGAREQIAKIITSPERRQRGDWFG